VKPTRLGFYPIGVVFDNTCTTWTKPSSAGGTLGTLSLKYGFAVNCEKLFFYKIIIANPLGQVKLMAKQST